MSIDEVLAEAREAADRLAESREGARESAIAAIRALERRLVELLAGDHFRGMPSLVFGRDFFAIRVRSPRDKRGDALVDQKKPVLVVADDGHLLMAEVVGGVAVVREAEDGDLLIEDVEQFADAALVALRSHLLGLSRTDAQNRALDGLAKGLLALLEPGFRAAKAG
jgi:hypothetical protein